MSEHSPLPWKAEGWLYGRDEVNDANGAPVCFTEGRYTTKRDPDSAYIELACNSYPALISEVERLRGRVKALEEERKIHVSSPSCWNNCTCGQSASEARDGA